MTELTFGQVEAVLAKLNRIASDKRVAFNSRLKHLQKQGLRPRDRRPGRGRAGRYNFIDLMMMAVAVELLQSGLPPQLAASLSDASWDQIDWSVSLALLPPEELREAMEHPNGPESTEWLWVLRPEMLAELSERGTADFDRWNAIIAVPEASLSEMLIKHADWTGLPGRALVLNGTRLTQAIVNILCDDFSYADRTALLQELLLPARRFTIPGENFYFMVYGPANADRRYWSDAINYVEGRLTDYAARYHPTKETAERIARKTLVDLPESDIARIQRRSFAGDSPADLRSQARLMLQGLLIPSRSSGSDSHPNFTLSGIGEAVHTLVAGQQVSPTAVEDERRRVENGIAEAIKERHAALLACDPNFPKDEALALARNGGPILPYSVLERILGEAEGDCQPSEDVSTLIGRMTENAKRHLIELHRAWGGTRAPDFIELDYDDIISDNAMWELYFIRAITTDDFDRTEPAMILTGLGRALATALTGDK